jgi:hypothetical protein
MPINVEFGNSHSLSVRPPMKERSRKNMQLIL